MIFQRCFVSVGQFAFTIIVSLNTKRRKGHCQKMLKIGLGKIL